MEFFEEVNLSIGTWLHSTHGNQLRLHTTAQKNGEKYHRSWRLGPLDWVDTGPISDASSVRNDFAKEIWAEMEGECSVVKTFFPRARFVWNNGAVFSSDDYKWRVTNSVEGLEFRLRLSHGDIQEYRIKTAKSLYLMKDCRNGFYKIGISKSPKLRESTLQAERPSIKMVGQWDGMSWMERELHKRFADQRLRGEWFNLEPAQVRWVCHHLTRATNE